MCQDPLCHTHTQSRTRVPKKPDSTDAYFCVYSNVGEKTRGYSRSAGTARSSARGRRAPCVLQKCARRSTSQSRSAATSSAHAATRARATTAYARRRATSKHSARCARGNRRTASSCANAFACAQGLLYVRALSPLLSLSLSLSRGAVVNSPRGTLYICVRFEEKNIERCRGLSLSLSLSLSSGARASLCPKHSRIRLPVSSRKARGVESRVTRPWKGALARAFSRKASACAARCLRAYSRPSRVRFQWRIWTNGSLKRSALRFSSIRYKCVQSLDTHESHPLIQNGDFQETSSPAGWPRARVVYPRLQFRDAPQPGQRLLFNHRDAMCYSFPRQLRKSFKSPIRVTYGELDRLERARARARVRIHL